MDGWKAWVSCHFVIYAISVEGGMAKFGFWRCAEIPIDQSLHCMAVTMILTAKAAQVCCGKPMGAQSI
ncbi:MAG: hypothetical protein IPO98_18585 [Saprospiraceae bacterium]|nr:hypothetical protein [Saprospiraceae bacterium]